MQQFKVLLVDDQEDDYIIIRAFLSRIQRVKFHLDWLSDYDEASVAIRKGEHDVYLLNNQLGKHTGLELLRKAVEMGSKAPLILLTGQDDPDLDMKAMKAGAADYLIKDEISAPILERSIRYSLERARMLQKLYELVKVDELTGLLNRREMNRLLNDEVHRCYRYHRPMSLTMLDIDHFKEVNDVYGHQIGDEVLRWLAQIVRDNVRAVDRVARYGGEEMAVILPETALDEAHRVAEDIRVLVASQPFIYVHDKVSLSFPITVSMGVASLGGSIDSEANLIRAADLALYHAKYQGRNCTVPFTDESLRTRPLGEMMLGPDPTSYHSTFVPGTP